MAGLRSASALKKIAAATRTAFMAADGLLLLSPMSFLSCGLLLPGMVLVEDDYSFSREVPTLSHSSFFLELVQAVCWEPSIVYRR